MNTQPEFKLEQTDIATVLTEGYPYRLLEGYELYKVMMTTKQLAEQAQQAKTSKANE